MYATVDLSGPWFHGRPSAAVDDLQRDLVDRVGSKAHSEVQMLLDQSIRNPTPYYETQVVRDRAATENVIHDSGVIYGPWLEGTGSRNATTRFKGYASFRRATQNVQDRVPSIVRPVVARWCDRMG